ncbi:PLP-dependent aminotransferase family protein [Paenibacillus macerans]|uniref:Aminotransferase class I and II family protein n=1 Tax=Paenibacillus macerans TaxID=44252 RepID=A0A090YBC0_PAEMA|nr:PLP-dependent aminotransferase family protein [Paenibacillus macerans]KFM95799.1 aminotransferase class I and II family protein [Paenibacillus macerans]MCY7556748.1 PLP-dependent aminotransferase family protein [Paenibacillus macerans]MEC0141482.1 PLP-dependent aminotransferase family protein [Paenibacillus macerans]MEC0153111.1 PLP-dependent aminotransferase family protein [Paenibacillus macerans]MUG22804.1 aminotransferase class I/II-fold pyridoxal phosphate-dependent enzyme [Paenibacillu
MENDNSSAFSAFSAVQADKLYEQVYDYVQERIRRGEWRADEKLPSVRKLAAELQVHRLTVFKAYQLLKASQAVYVKDKSGYYVSPGSSLPAETRDDPIVLASVQGGSLSEIHQVQADYQYSKALLDPNLLPNHYFSEYVKKVFDLYPKVLGTYGSIQGDMELREALCGYLADQYHFHLSADELLITSGSQEAIDLLARVLVKPRDAVLMERPTYSPAIDVFRGRGANIVPIEISESGYRLDEVERLMQSYKPRLFYLNPTFHNPTGYTIPAEQRKRLVELAQQYQCLLIEDDPYRDIYFGKKPPLPLFAYDTEGWTIYIRSFSKYVAPGLSIAATACRPPVMKHILKARSLSNSGTPLLNQKIFLHYFFSQRMQQHLEKLRIALAIRRDIMEEELAAAGWEWSSPEGGFNLWVKLPETVSIDRLLVESVKQSITFVPGSICDPLKSFSSWIRLSYSYLNEQQSREGLKRFVGLCRMLERWE